MAPLIPIVIKHRWKTIGNRLNPEPPTLVAKLCAEKGKGELWLGALPTESRLEEILACVGDNGGSFTIQVSCFAKPPWENFVVDEKRCRGKVFQERGWSTQGVMLPGVAWFTVEMSNPNARARGIRRCRNIILSSLLAGENCYIHCVTG